MNGLLVRDTRAGLMNKGTFSPGKKEDIHFFDKERMGAGIFFSGE